MRCLGLTILIGLQTQVPPEVEKAQETLATKPDNQQANLIVGKYHLGQGEVEKAVPFLLKGSDSSLKAIAKSEEAAADLKGAKLVALGDEWLKLYPKGPLRQACVDRANYWYAKAWPDLDVNQKVRLLQKLEILYAGPRAAPKLAYPRGWGGSGGRIVSDRIRSGSFSFSTPTVPPSGTRPMLFSEWVIVEPNKPCVFTCWVLTDGTDSANDFVTLSLAPRDFSRVPKRFECGLPKDLPIWTILSVSFTPEEPSRVQMNMELHSMKGKIYLDDISLKADGKEMIINGGFE